MRRAITLSALGLGTTSPNPPVGCVILNSSGIPVGEGYHQRKGEAHAEVHALAAAGDDAVGGTAVVTLEPCNHHGRTPPCRRALLDAQVARVVIAVLDPTSRGEGGAAVLRHAGVSVEVGVLKDEALLVLQPWLSTLVARRPHITWAYRIDSATGNPAPLKPEAENDLRFGYDVVIADEGRFSEGVPGAHGIDMLTLSFNAGEKPIAQVITSLYDAGARTVLINSSPQTAHALLIEGVIDQLVIDVPCQDASHRPETAVGLLPKGFCLRGIAPHRGYTRLWARRGP